MFLNIKTGYRGIQQRSNQEIVIVFASLHDIKKQGVPFVFTDRHAYLEAADQPFDDLAHLDKIDWTILQRSDFKREPDNPGKVERYEAEALVHKHLPIDVVDGIACCDSGAASTVEQQVKQSGKAIEVVVKQAWYFS